MKHTPGPWKHFDGSIYAVEPSVGEEVMISQVAPESQALTEYDWFNANLIAAAPELLEALEGCLTCAPELYNMPIGLIALEAIKKARGET